ncbi:hypothetical protein A1507_05740 [Methylomonas koyamae]|uniref:Uncharacterized protein n=1 Tax=Methylomonas koyamae TaxID=702114 RepID=A0A177NQL8_9GAMM|nr:hypothetical protein [Methylomonas koyamae]OAI19854.1 hypothetical protein A1507_05740 [Methylomonas koyamae]
MILVYFRGYGEWFIRGSDGKKLAIPRTTDIPYRKNEQPRQIEQDVSLSYDEWRGDLDDSDELFSEWAHEYERQKKNRETEQNAYLFYGDDTAKPGEYDYHLDGIFYIDKDAEGDVFDTSGLNACGVNYMKCREIDGIFKLTEEEEKYFRLTNIDPKTDWDEFRKIVKKLIPCEHSESAFFKEVRRGKLSNDDFDKVEFQIQTKWIRDLYGRSEPIFPKEGENNLRFVSMDKIVFLPDLNYELKNSDTINNSISKFTPAYLDKTNPLFNINNELHLAIDAWKTIVEPETGSCKNIKKNIINWLSSNSAFKLTEDQKNRIAAVANPDRARKQKDALMFKSELALEISDSEKYLDCNHKNHSSWLRAAIEAWMYTLGDTPEPPKTGSLKSLPIKWLNANYPTISKRNIQRLAVLINPDSNGGAPKSI